MVRNSVVSVMNFSLTPIPLFVLMGEVLFHTGLAIKVIDGVERLIRQVPGRLAVVAVVAGTVFSAISGSTIATTAMLGSLMLPVMLARGYHPTMATGPDHGDRRRRHADPALGADRAARQPVRDLDLQAADRRRGPGPDAVASRSSPTSWSRAQADAGARAADADRRACAAGRTGACSCSTWCR